MNWIKRYSLFFLVNILVIITISATTSLLGLNHYLEANGINYEALLGFCLVWGMAGSLISLSLSRVMAKKMMKVQVLDSADRFQTHADLINTVHRLARQAGIQKMPEVGVYSASDLNAFATGPTKNRALVAVSSGLLEQMDKDELEGVLAHEVAHIANGDMVTMTLLQGVINAFVMFLARVLAHAISAATRSSDSRGNNYVLFRVLTVIFELVLSILGFMVVCAFSRHREFRADAGGAKLAGREKMKAALSKLQQKYSVKEENSREAIAAFKISAKSGHSLARLFATHPPLEERIKALQ